MLKSGVLVFPLFLAGALKGLDGSRGCWQATGCKGTGGPVMAQDGALTEWLRGRGLPGSHEVLGDPATDPPAEQGRAWTINRMVAGDVCSV